jgi:hypothetical protein
VNTAEGSASPVKGPGTKVLITGWFSFPYHHATAGDLLACDVVGGWLDEAALPFDVALGAPFQGGVDWRTVVPADYSHLLFVCGPVGPSRKPVTELLRRFDSLTRIAVNVTMQEPLDLWNPFDILLERDSSATTRPDLTFASRAPAVPVLGLILVEPYAPEEHPGRDIQRVARDAIHRVLHARKAAIVPIDTRLDVNATYLRTASEVESAIARMDAVVTTRLHGMVLALKNGVPALAVDSVAGGAKIRLQADRLGWPAVLTADTLSEAALHEALDFCLSEEGRRAAAECASRALADTATTRADLLAALGARAAGASGNFPGHATARIASATFTTLPATVIVIAESGSSGLLTACLESLAACAPRAAEVLVTEPAGGKTAAEAVRMFGDERVRIAPGRHTTRGAALNAALQLAGNDIVLLTKDDCLASASWVVTGWSRVAADPTTLVTGQVLPLEDSRRVPTNMHAPRPMLPPRRNWGEVDGWVMACDRHRVLAAGGFDERSPMAEDLDLRYRLSQSGQWPEYEPELIVWRQNWRTDSQLRQLARATAVQRGAFYAKHLRLGDRGVARLATAELRAGVRSFAAAVRYGRRSWSDPRRGILYGLPAGLARGWTLRAPEGLNESPAQPHD